VYYVVDPYGERVAASEAEFRVRRLYEEGSVRLPWYVTPPALLLILVGWLMERRRNRSGPEKEPPPAAVAPRRW